MIIWVIAPSSIVDIRHCAMSEIVIILYKRKKKVTILENYCYQLQDRSIVEYVKLTRCDYVPIFESHT